MNQFIAAIGFPVITIVFYGFALSELKKGLQRTSFDDVKKRRVFNRVLLVLIFWVAFISALSLSGFTQDFGKFPLNVAPMMLIPLITLFIATFTKTAKEILVQIEPQAIVRLQSFRVLVELVIWLLFIEKLLPVQMTFEGRNLDILSGLTAPIIAWLLANNKINKTVLAVWNLACLGLLINIVSVAILSMPSPIQSFFNEPSNTAVAKFPYIFLPAFLVPLAYMLHFFSLRQLSLQPMHSRQTDSKGQTAII